MIMGLLIFVAWSWLCFVIGYTMGWWEGVMPK